VLGDPVHVPWDSPLVGNAHGSPGNGVPSGLLAQDGVNRLRLS
jgi:hypothetical protein